MAAAPPPLVVEKAGSAFREATAALVAIFAQEVGAKYGWSGGKDGEALSWCLQQGDVTEVTTRWRRGLRAPPGWLQVRTVAQLRQKWNDLATPTSRDPDANGGIVRTKGVDYSDPSTFAYLEAGAS
jgi:hypothetical protein